MKTLLRPLFLTAVFLCVTLAVAAQPYSGVETFENYRGPATFNTRPGDSIPPLHAGPLTLTSGMPLTDSQAFGQGTVYASAGAVVTTSCEVQLVCNGCANGIYISASQPFEELSLDVIQANVPEMNGANVIYKISNADGPQSFVFFLIDGRLGPINIPSEWHTKGIVVSADVEINTNAQCDVGGGTLYYFAVDNIQWRFARPRRLKMAAGPTIGDVVYPQTITYGNVSDAGTVDITYPLGLPFHFQVERRADNGQWQPLDLKVSVDDGTYVAFPDKLSRQLYHFNHLWVYDPETAGEYKSFQTVHTGDVSVEVEPQNQDGSWTDVEPFEVLLHIVKPSALGDDSFPSTYDSRISDLADEAGIPPQYIKAQVAAETNKTVGGRNRILDGRLWLYKPIEIDYWQLHSLYSNINFLRQPPYSDYMLKEESLSVPEGGLLCPVPHVTFSEANHNCAFLPPVDDLLARYRTGLQWVKPDGEYALLTATDDQQEPVTIRRIFNANNFDPPNDRSHDPSPGYGTLSLGGASGTTTNGVISGRPRPVPHPSNDLLGGTAQTPMASTYGLMQVAPVDIINLDEWRGVTPQGSSEPRFNPSLLFDDPDNEEAMIGRAGSLIPGINRDIGNYWGNPARPFYRNADEYLRDLRGTFGYYRASDGAYASKIVDDYAYSCLPKSNTNIYKPASTSTCGPQISMIADDSTTTPGGTVVLSVSTAVGGNVTAYQWYQGESGNTSAPLPNSDSSTISVTPAASTSYWVAVSNTCGTTSSNSIHVTVAPVCPPLSITAEPAGGSISSGGSFTLHVVASGATSYQWYVGAGSEIPGMDGDRSTPVANSNTPDLTVSPSATTKYWVLVMNGCRAIASRTAVVAVDCNPPAISVQPQSRTIAANESAVLTVAVDGTAPLNIRWFTTSGAAAGTGSTITVSPVNPTTYFARISNACGIVDSQAAVITPPCVPASIASQSSGVTIEQGHATTLSVDLGGTPPHIVEWRAADESVAGNGATILIAPASTTTYYAHVTNACGSVNSAPVTVTVTTAPDCTTPVITAQPASQSVQPGQAASLTVSTSSPNATYQWYHGLTGTGLPISGATAATYSVAPSGTTTYWVRVTAACGPSADSSSATVTVCDPMTPVVITGNASIPLGQSTILTAAAAGSNITYQWFAGKLGDTTQPIYNGAHSITVNPRDTTRYWVRATSACGSSTAAEVTVSVCALPVIDMQPADVTIQSGTTATLTAWASDATTTPLTYQWYQGTSGDVTTPVGTGANFTTPVLTQDAHYWVRIWCDVCGPVDSQTVSVAMCQMPSTIGGPADQFIGLGQTAHLVIPPFSPAVGNWFFWYQGASGDTSHPLGDFGGDWGLYNYLDVSPTVTTQYWAAVQNGNYGSCLAATATVTVNVCVPAITLQPSGLMINAGQPTTLTVAATLGQTYQWYVGASGDTSSPIAGATGTSYTVSPTVGTSYWVRVTGSCGRSVDSSTATITICQPAAITVQPTGGSITRGQSLGIGVSATGTSLSYQWYQGTSGDTANPVYGNTPGITVNPLNPTDYWVKVSGVCGAAVNSSTAHVSVCTTPVINTQPIGAYVFSGQTATLTVAASEATGEVLHYQWYTSVGSPVGSDSPTFTTPAMTQATQYYVHITAGGCSVDSNTVTVGVCTLPQVINTGTTSNVAIGQNVTLSCLISPGTGNTFTWYAGPVGDVVHSTQISSNSSYTYSFTAAATSGGTYWASVSRSDDGCVSHTNAYTVNVCIPTITTQPAASTMINSGQQLTLTVAANTSGLTYQWYVGTSGTTTTPITNATGASVTVSPTSNTNYWVKVTGTCGQSVNSNTAAVTICVPASITTQPAALSNIVRGANVNLAVTAAGNGLTYQWYQGPSGNTSAPLAATTPGLTIAPINPIDYWVKVTGTCGSVNSNTAHVSVCTTPVINTQPANTSTFSGTSATLTVSAYEATGETLHYQWYKNTSTPVGTDSATLNTGALTADTMFYVHITASSGTCAVDSSTATVTMCPLPQSVTGAPNQNTTPGQTVRLQLGSMPGATAYMWYSGTSGNTAAPVTSWQAANYIDVSPTTTSSWWAQVQNGSCVSNTTTTTVNVCIPTIMTQPQNVTVSAGPTTLTVVSNLPGSTYQWYVGTSGTTTTPITNATSASVSVSPSTTTSYWCKVSGSCGTANSNTATVTICSAPNITTQPVNATPVYRNSTSGLSVTATGTNLTYQWYVGATGDTSHPVSGATSASYSTTAYNTEKYWVRVSGMCGTRDSNAVWISVIPQFLGQPTQTTYLSSGSRVMLSVNVYPNAYLHFAWCYDANGQTVPGSPDSASWITPDITASNTYFCRVTSGIAATESYRAYVNLCDGGNSAGQPYTQNAGGSCRYLWSQADGNYDHIEWYQGQKGDVSYQIGTGYYVYTCSNVGTTVWYRVVGYDSNQGQSCYTDSPSLNVQ